MALSKKTLVEFRETLSTWSLREIADVFESEGVPLREDFDPKLSGQRRTLAAKYLHSINLDHPRDVATILKVIEHVLVTLAPLRDKPNPYNAEEKFDNLVRWLQRDGFEFRNYRLTAIDGTSAPTSTAEPPVPPKEVIPEPALSVGSTASLRPPTAFVSYSWDDEEHKQWALEFATELRRHGVDAKLDRWEVSLGDPLPQFMETAVRTNDHVLIVLTQKYREKSDGRKGGVGYEGHIMTAEIFTGKDPRKFIPVLREGDWHDSSPSWLLGKAGVDLRGVPYSAEQFQDLVQTLLGTRAKAPPLGPYLQVPKPIARGQGTFTPPPPPPQEFEPIRIVNVIVSEVGTPRDDGTRGSALYAVPFQLSRPPSREWAEHFVRTWDNPPSFNLRHRPGIARVVGDRLILDGTTVEEVAEVHRNTLKDVVERVNQDIAEYERRQRQVAQAKAEELRRHQQAVEDAAKRIHFD